jgi:hypothetical protein
MSNNNAMPPNVTLRQRIGGLVDEFPLVSSIAITIVSLFLWECIKNKPIYRSKE